MVVSGKLFGIKIRNLLKVRPISYLKIKPKDK
jgi:hypothetical protein